MTVERLELENFRCHKSATLSFEHTAILITGPNGAGKTSILEAINLTALSKSFLAVNDGELVHRGAPGYRVTTRLRHDIGTQFTISVEYYQGNGKRIQTSVGGDCTAQELIGLLPCVVLATHHRELFHGEPMVRRAFADRILAQCFASYKHALWRHRTALRQRNHVLAFGRSHTEELEGWTAELLEASCEIIWQRMRFVERFNALLLEVSGIFDNHVGSLALQYELPWFRGVDVSQLRMLASIDELRTLLSYHVEQLVPVDRERMSTQWGPQRDLLTFCVEQRPLYTVASQGQQKLALYAIKVAEALYIHRAMDRAPVLLLDDVFADLDSGNVRRIESSILQQSRQWQIFVTAPTVAFLDHRTQFQPIVLERHISTIH